MVTSGFGGLWWWWWIFLYKRPWVAKNGKVGFSLINLFFFVGGVYYERRQQRTWNFLIITLFHVKILKMTKIMNQTTLGQVGILFLNKNYVYLNRYFIFIFY